MHANHIITRSSNMLLHFTLKESCLGGLIKFFQKRFELEFCLTLTLAKGQQRQTNQIYDMDHTPLFLLPTMCGLATPDIKLHGSSSSLHAQCFVYVSISLTLPTQDGFNCKRFAEATSIKEEISASNTYTCTILLCYHALYSRLILVWIHIPIAFTHTTEKIPQKNSNSWHVNYTG